MSSDSMGLPCSGAALVSMVHVCIETWIGIHATTANPRHTMPRDSDGDSSCRLRNSIGLCLFPLCMSGLVLSVLIVNAARVRPAPVRVCVRASCPNSSSYTQGDMTLQDECSLCAA
jgi:hypothetical protein